MCKSGDKLTIALIASPFILVMFVIAVVLMNTNRTPSSNLAVKNLSENNTQVAKNIWIQTSKKNIRAGEKFSFDIFMNTNNLELGAFAINIDIPKSEFVIDNNQENKGVIKGRDAKNFMIVTALKAENFKFSGICAQNCVQGQAQHVATVYFIAKDNLSLPESINFLKVTELATTLGKNFELEKYQGNILIKLNK